MEQDHSERSEMSTPKWGPVARGGSGYLLMVSTGSWLPRFVLPGCSKNVTPSQAFSSQSIDPSPNRLIFPSCAFSFQVKVTCQAGKKTDQQELDICQGYPSSTTTTHNCEIRGWTAWGFLLWWLWQLREAQTGELEDSGPREDFEVFWKKSINTKLCYRWRMSPARWPWLSHTVVLSGVAPLPCPPYPIFSSITELCGLHVFHCKEVGQLWLVPSQQGCPPWQRSFQMNQQCRFLAQCAEKEFLISVLLYTHLHNIFWFSELQSH